MSLLKVLKFPDPFLREKSKPVKEVTSSIQQLVESMFATMVEEGGIGLAAPQVHEKLRVIVMDVPEEETDQRQGRVEGEAPAALPMEGATRAPIAMINPEIVTGDGLIQYEEGCLSCPEILVWVDRMANIEVKYLDIDGKPSSIIASGLKAVCVQHEIDHLNGVLLVDRLSRLKRDVYKKKRLRIIKDEKDLKNIL